MRLKSFRRTKAVALYNSRNHECVEWNAIDTVTRFALVRASKLCNGNSSAGRGGSLRSIDFDSLVIGV